VREKAAERDLNIRRTDLKQRTFPEKVSWWAVVIFGPPSFLFLVWYYFSDREAFRDFIYRLGFGYALIAIWIVLEAIRVAIKRRKERRGRV
jgi:hypothetical protein